MSNFIFLNSKDRVAGQNNDCVFYLNNYDYYRGTVDISIESFECLNFQYPIRSVNNQFVFSENGNPALLTATLPQGVYTALTIASELQTQLNAVGANTYSVVYNPIPRTITISTPIPDTFAISDNSTILDILGFNPIDTTFTSTKTGQCPVNVSGDDYIDIELKNFQNGNIITSYISNSIFHRIPINVDFGQSITYKNDGDHIGTSVSGEVLNSIYVRLLNKDGEGFIIPPNINWSLTLRINATE